jgi:hypothetical protein
VQVGDDVWSFEHLRSYSFPYTIETAGSAVELQIDIVFSCHCFSRKPELGTALPDAPWVYKTATETRILDRERYDDSRNILPGMMHELVTRRILFAGTENFMTIETINSQGKNGYYQVFFVVSRKEGVKRRLELKVQSAYFVEDLHRRAQPKSMRPVRFKLIATAAYERRKLRPGR